MRFFKAGCIVLILTGALHLFGHFSPKNPGNETEKQLLELMENYKIPKLGISMMSLQLGLSLLMSLWLFASGIAGLWVVRQPVDLKMAMWFYVVQVGIAVTIAFMYFFIAPLACLVLAFILLLTGAILSSRQTN